MDQQQVISDIRTKGFAIIPDVLSKKSCEHFKSLLEDSFEKYSPHYHRPQNNTAHALDNKKNEKVVFNLHNKSLDWFQLFEHPTVTSILDILLKEGSYKNQEPYHLLNISARSPLKDTGDQQLHLDSNLPGGDFPIIMVVLWMLDDFTKDTGATRVVPGSHKFTTYAEDNIVYDSEVLAEGKQGSVLIYNASLWHAGGKNFTDNTRWGLVLGYGRWFIKPSFDFLKNTPIEVFEQLTDSQRELLGFRSAPPLDEFTRMKRRSDVFESPLPYKLP
ncbi:MAG: phytanoyl-CoA dioxygenase family protein [Opitutaceae bacterium]|nr:phytanoyl-CoA dioxygenase family protein [Cytophagales bacterium]